MPFILNITPYSNFTAVIASKDMRQIMRKNIKGLCILRFKNQTLLLLLAGVLLQSHSQYTRNLTENLQ